MSTFKEMTGASIQEAFERYHRTNPNVYAKIKKMALEAIYKGKKRISFKLIIEVIRWEVFMDTTDQLTIFVEGEKRMFKINNAYESRYARLFLDEYPHYADRVETRRLRA
jgi:hypothetical protein